MKIQNKIIVVTGGGNGMGRELTLHLLSEGAKVVAVDINATALQETVELTGSNKHALTTMLADITNKESVENLLEKTLEIHGAVDGIINNAGIIQPFQKLETLDFNIIEKVMNVNFFGALNIIKTFLPHLLTRPEAHIVNVSSMGGFLPVPGQSIYGASKAAVKILSESLTSELKATNVRVTTVFPGAIFTNIKTNSGLGEKAGLNASECSEAPKGTLHSSMAAEIIIRSMEQNKTRVFVGKDSKTMNFLYRLNPAFACKLIYNKMKAKI